MAFPPIVMVLLRSGSLTGRPAVDEQRPPAGGRRNVACGASGALQRRPLGENQASLSARAHHLADDQQRRRADAGLGGLGRQGLEGADHQPLARVVPFSTRAAGVPAARPWAMSAAQNRDGSMPTPM